MIQPSKFHHSLVTHPSKQIRRLDHSCSMDVILNFPPKPLPFPDSFAFFPPLMRGFPFPASFFATRIQVQPGSLSLLLPRSRPFHPYSRNEENHFCFQSLTALHPPKSNLHQNKDDEMGFYSGMPSWLENLLAEKFFSPCAHHEGVKKNEKNILCLDCCFGFCPHCILPHRSHRLLQIRRYVYHDVVRVEDLEKLIDMSLVQSYTTNSSKVAFLKQRAQSRPFRGSGNGCRSCDRPLQESFLYCSLSCKVKQLMASDGELSRHLRKCEYLPLSIDEDGHLTPDSILESPGPDSSGSMGSGGAKDTLGGGGAGPLCAAVEEYSVQRSRSCAGVSLGTVAEPASSLRRRWRKMARPNRSPLF